MKPKLPKEKKGELVKAVVKKSNQVIFWPMIFFLVGFALIVCVTIFLGFSYYFSITFLFWLVFFGGYLFLNIYIKNKSFTIITNHRIINIEQYGIASFKVNELAIKDIKKITFKKNGFLAKTFDSGSVYMFIKDSNDFLPIDFVSDPKNAAKKLSDLI